jgi:membrane protease YdiL (CAAX protease family)
MTGHPLAFGELGFVLAVSWCTLGFASYYFLSHNKIFVSKIGILLKEFDSQGNQVILQRMLGLFFLGIVSALLIFILPGMTLKDYGLSFSFSVLPPWWSYLLIPLILGLGNISARKPGNLARYPQIRQKKWTPRLLLISAITWILFLIGYEFLFRGFLLQASLDLMNPLPAFALNGALYALAHAYKGPGETYGSIPVGIVLCYLSLVTGNIWSAVILHSIMALSNEWLSIQAHPDMKISISIE